MEKRAQEKCRGGLQIRKDLPVERGDIGTRRSIGAQRRNERGYVDRFAGEVQDLPVAHGRVRRACARFYSTDPFERLAPLRRDVSQAHMRETEALTRSLIRTAEVEDAEPQGEQHGERRE